MCLNLGHVEPKNPTNLFDYFVIGRKLVVEEDELGSAFCQRVILYFLLWAVIPFEFRKTL